MLMIIVAPDNFKFCLFGCFVFKIKKLNANIKLPTSGIFYYPFSWLDVDFVSIVFVVFFVVNYHPRLKDLC